LSGFFEVPSRQTYILVSVGKSRLGEADLIPHAFGGFANNNRGLGKVMVIVDAPDRSQEWT
jgi:hypothetical protein